jgi:hypothetical protein
MTLKTTDPDEVAATGEPDDAAAGTSPPSGSELHDDGQSEFDAAWNQAKEVLLDPAELLGRQAVEPRYTTSAPDEEIPLYNGTVRLTSDVDGSASIQGNGGVTFRWRAVPRVSFSMRSTSPLLPRGDKHTLMGGDGTLDLIDSAILCKVIHQGPGHGDDEMVHTSGFFKGITAPAARADRVLFHIANLADFHGAFATYPSVSRQQAYRTSLDAAGWQIIIDGVPSLRDLAPALRAQGGYAITHAGSLRRDDGSEFTYQEASDVLADLGYLLSFASGRWAMPFMLVGMDATGADRWQDWMPRKLSPWVGTSTWWNEEAWTLEEAFPGFMARRGDPKWRSNLDVLVAWYVESCTGAATVETAIVLTQAALELVSWVLLVDDMAVIPASVFDRKPAAEKFRELLKVIKIPADIPPELSELVAEAQRLSRRDGPHALTAMRNSIVHSHKIDEVLEAKPMARYQVKMLGLWYLEMAILWLAKYESVYRSRLGNRRYAGDEKPVPWAKGA